jgi:hypothetical protein
VLLRAMPELEGEIEHVVNAFNWWARDRGEYYSLDWKPRADSVRALVLSRAACDGLRSSRSLASC